MKIAALPKFSSQLISGYVACRVFSTLSCPKSTLVIPNAKGSLYPVVVVLISSISALKASVVCITSIEFSLN